MKKLLALTVAALVLAGVAAGTSRADTAQTVTTPVGTLNFDLTGDSVAASSFSFDGATVAPDPTLESLNGDEVGMWACGSDTCVKDYPGFLRYQTLECVRIVFTLNVNDPPPSPDTGWRCVQDDEPFTQESIIATSLQYPATATIPFTGVGNTARNNGLPECYEPQPADCLGWYDPGATDVPQVDLSPYAGVSVTGLVFANTCTRIFLDVTYYPPGGYSGTNNYLGCEGTAEPTAFQLNPDRRTAAAGAACAGYNPRAPAGGSCNPTALQLRIPGGCVVPKRLAGKTVASARKKLEASNCRLGKVTRVHSRVKKGRVVKPRYKPGSVHRVHTRVPLLVSRGRKG